MASQARTAGRAFRVWRLQRSINGDVDALSASKQEDLGRFLARTGGDGRRTYADLRAVDSDAADALAAIDNPVTQRQFVNAYQRGEVDSDELATALRRYDELDASGEDTAEELIASTGDDGVDLLANANGDTVRVALDGSGSLDQSFRRSIARAADGDTIDSYDQLDRAIRDIEDLSGPRQRRAKELVANTEGEGIRLVDEMDSDTQETFFNLGQNDRINRFDDFDRWRSAVANAEDVDTTEAGRYAERIDQAADYENIDNLEGILDDTTPRTDAVAGESGEAASAIRYADDGADVEIEPGRNGDYDMSIKQGGQTEYVEVKTRTEKDVDYMYVNTQISEMNRKYENALDDPNVDVSENPQVLEIRTRAESDELSSAQSAAETVLDDRTEVQVDEIRLVAENGDTVTIEP